MNNQQQDDADRVANWVQHQSMNHAGLNVLSAEFHPGQGDVAGPVQPHNAFGIQSGLPSDAGNENHGVPHYPPGPDQRHGVGDHPGPVPNPDPVQIDTSKEFITTPFPPLEYRKFTVEKRISSAEWVSANAGILEEMAHRHRSDVPFRAFVRHRISPDLWPIIPLAIRPRVYGWLTQYQQATLTSVPPCDFQTEMTIVEEHIIPPHPEEVHLRALEADITNLPDVYSDAAARIKLEINAMFARHLRWMGRNKKARRWLMRQIDEIHQSTIAMWINSWSGRLNGIRPPINPDGRTDA